MEVSLYNFLEKLVLPLGDLLNSSDFIKMLQYWRQVDLLSERELEDLQENNLRNILIHARENLSIYSDIALKGNDPQKWIKQFPILEKSDLKLHTDSYLHKPKTELIKYSSSGSSGVQSSVFMSKLEQSNIRAILIHWWEWAGYKMGAPLVQTGITPDRGLLKSVKDYLFNTVYIDAFVHSEAQLDSICKRFEKKNGQYFMAGYASSLFVIAEYAAKLNYDLKLVSVISFGDKMFEHYRKKIKQTFKCEVFDTYGCNEGFLIASQKDLDYKYIMSPHVYLEIIDDQGNEVPDGTLGNVVVSRLDSFSMPLLRYKIGDMAIKLPRSEYPERREYKYPLLKKVVGRTTDIIHLPSGNTMNVHSFTGVFEYIPAIKQFQVSMPQPDRMNIKYIKGSDFNGNTLNEVTSSLQRYIQDSSFHIDFENVDFIPPSKSGKPEIIVGNKS
ncbi:MAG: hypothetical protein WBG46_10985 [Nonlabens sp.]